MLEDAVRLWYACSVCRWVCWPEDSVIPCMFKRRAASEAASFVACELCRIGAQALRLRLEILSSFLSPSHSHGVRLY